MATKAFLEQAYLAYFGRPIDPNGVAAFVNATETEVENAFFASPESQALFGDTFGLQQINVVYNTLFGRDAEPAGLAYWANQIVIGNLTPAGAAIGILRGALNDDIIAVNNKLAASAAFTAGLDTTEEILGFAGDAAAAVSREFLASITMTPATQAEVDAAIAAAVAVGSNTGGDVFTLTTGQDIIVGTAGNDLINGFINYDIFGGSTLNSGDTINGGNGVDTLRVVVEDESENNLNLNMVNVERMIINDFDGQTFYVQNVAGLETVVLQGDGGEYTYFEDGTYIVPNIEFRNTESYFEQDAGVVDVIPMLNVLVDNSYAEVYQYSDNANSRANYTNATITSTGTGPEVGTFGKGVTSNYLYLGESQGVDTVTVNGTTNLELDIEHFYAPTGTAGSVKTVDASALEAGLKLYAYFEGAAASAKTVKGGTGNDLFYDYSQDDGLAISYTTGTGNDKVEYFGGGASNKYAVDTGAGNDMVLTGGMLATGDLLDGGEGTDTLGMTSVAAIAATALTGTASTGFQALFSNFETLGLGGALAGNIDMAKLDGINNVKLADGVGGASTIKGLTTGASIENNANGGSVLTVDGTLSVLNYTVKATGSTYTSLTAAAETLNITSTTTNTVPSSVSNDIHLSAAGHKTINVTGNTYLTLDHVSLTSVETVDAASFDAGLGLDLWGNTNDVTVTAGNGDNYIYGADGMDTITTGSGSDFIYGQVGNDTINSGGGIDTIEGGLGLDTLTGGAGVDTFAYTAAAESQGTTVDTITDFVSGTDKIQTTTLVVYAGEANGYGAVLTSLTGVAYQGVLDTSTSSLYIDVNGDKILNNLDMAINLTGVTDLAQADFMI